jgi:hypothetical protein
MRVLLTMNADRINYYVVEQWRSQQGGNSAIAT